MDYKTNICHIVAKSKDNAIGIDGRIPWNIPEDLHRFKKLTMGCPVIMGRKTAESLPGPLKGRHLIVVTHNPYKRIGGLGADYANSIEDATSLAEDFARIFKTPIYIAGGQDVYGQTADYINTIVMTEVNVNLINYGIKNTQDVRHYCMPTGFKCVGRKDMGSHSYLNYVRI